MEELHIGPFAVLMTLIIGSPSVSVQGVGCLVLWAVALTRRGDELNLLGISLLGFGLLALIHVMERHWSRATYPSSFRRSTATLTPQANASAMVISSSVTLGELGRWIDLDEVRGRLLGAHGSTAGNLRSCPHDLWGGSVFAAVGGVVPHRPASQVPRRGWGLTQRSHWCGLQFAGAYERAGLPRVSYREALGRVLGERRTFLVKHQQLSQQIGGTRLGRLVDPPGAVFPPPASAWRQLPLVQGWRSRTPRPLALPLLAVHKTKKKLCQNQTKKPINTGAANTLRKTLKKPVQRLPVAKLAFPPFRPSHRIYRLPHELGDRSRLFILPDVIVEVAGHLPLLSRWLPKGVPDGFALIPIRNVSLTQLTVYKKEAILSMFHR
ncbi:hypothetical protein Cgig2_027445 [Carnegiea gigantea]|uniref:Uncharacterized protein n=1 Tax=Carnegiea gigantea TaxID=171969 RepID=A0A9Q1GHK4_9CARY|nr:hypothetical protein Cgig2_027445 [Carnegiea gigantea]